MYMRACMYMGSVCACIVCVYALQKCVWVHMCIYVCVYVRGFVLRG